MGSSGSLSDFQRKHFTDRIRRIEAGGPGTSGTIYAGLDEQQHRRKRRRRNRTGPSLVSQLFMVPFAIVVGAGAMLAGRVGAYHALATPEFITPDYASLFSLTGDIGIAVLLATVLVLLFNLGSAARLLAFMLGFVGIMLGESYVIAQAPEAFAGLFSEDYVQTAVAKAPADPFSPEALGL